MFGPQTEPIVVDGSCDLNSPEGRIRDCGNRRGVPAATEDNIWAVHTCLREAARARHLVEVFVARLLRLMKAQRGWRRWGTRSLSAYLTEDLRQPSIRRFQYLVSIDEALVSRPLRRLERAWRNGRLGVSRMRELIRVATPDNEVAWLAAATRMTVGELRDAIDRGLNPGEPDAAGPASLASGPAASGSEGASRPEERWQRRSFAASPRQSAVWDAAIETSRRMAGYDQPLHECVEDLLAERASDLPLPENLFHPEGERGAAMRRAARLIHEERLDLTMLRETGRLAWMRSDPLDGLDASPDPQELHSRIRRLLRLDSRIAWHEAKLLRALADLQGWRRMGFASLAEYSEELLDSGDRRPYALISLCRRLDRLEKVSWAFRDGLITALEAAEVCRVASDRSQDAWVERARVSSLRALREDVAWALDSGSPSPLPPPRSLPAGSAPVAEGDDGRDDGECCGPVGPDWSESGGAGLQICAPPGGGHLAHEPCEGRGAGLAAEQAAERFYSAFLEDPVAVARGALLERGRARIISLSLPPATAGQWDATLARTRESVQGGEHLSDGQLVALVALGVMKVWAHPRLIRRARAQKVLTRDGWRCQAPGCSARCRLHVHHIVFRSHSGPDEQWNLVAVCRTHHAMLHAGAVRVTGRAPGGLVWSMGVNAAGQWRQLWANGLRVGSRPGWRAGGAELSTRGPADWRRRMAS